MLLSTIRRRKTIAQRGHKLITTRQLHQQHRVCKAIPACWPFALVGSYDEVNQHWKKRTRRTEARPAAELATYL